MSARKTNLFFLLGLLAALTALNHRVFFEGHSFVLIDGSLFFLPLWKWGSVCLAKGILPLWNPDTAFGTPYLADPETTCFYPPVIAAFQLLKASTALNALILGHYSWALLGFWVFGRYKKMEPWALLLGCLVFGFSVNATSLPLATTMLLTFSWTPWVFWSAERLFKNEKGCLVLFSLIVALQMVSGYPLFCYLTLLGLFFEMVIGSLAGEKDKSLPLGAWLKMTAAGLAALAYNLVWLFPFWEFKQFSNTQERLGFTTDVTWPYLATWLNPFYMGHPLHSYTGLHPAVGNYFFGLPVVVLLAFYVLKNKKRTSTLWVFLLLLVLSLGQTAVLADCFRRFFPGYGWVVRSGYIIFLVGFFTARLTAEAAGFLFKKKGPADQSRFAMTVLVLATYLSALLLGVPVDLLSFWVSFGLMLLAAMGGFLSIPLRHALLALGLVFSLGPVVQSLNFTMPNSFYEKPQEFLPALDKPGRIFHTHEVISYYWSLPGASVGDVYQKMKNGLISNWPLTCGLEETYFNNSFYLRSYEKWEFQAMRFSDEISRKVLDYLDVRYVFGENHFHGLRILDIPTTVPAYENPGALPKWYSVQTAFPQGGWEGDMKGAGEASFDFRKDCFVLDKSAAGNYFPQPVREIPRSINRLELETEGGGKSLLVSSETDYPGWKAKVEGKDRAFLDVNYGFRGLLLEKGEGKIEMAYRPGSFRLGCFFLLLACGFWTSLLLNFLFPLRLKHASS